MLTKYTIRLMPAFAQRSFGVVFRHNSSDACKLQHVGTRLPEMKSDEKTYKIGQTFLHKVFAYRGVIIHPWQAQVSEQNKYHLSAKLDQDLETKSKKEVYYQVLIDNRDVPLHRDDTFFVTTIKSDPQQNSGSMTGIQTVLGMDYVSHDEVIPYESCESPRQVHNDLFNTFFNQQQQGSQSLQATEKLVVWKKNNYKSLKLNKVYRETTGEIRITAIPFFLGSKQTTTNHRHGNSKTSSEYWWRYSVRVENLGDSPCRLQERHWRIISNGSVKTVRGRGVLGEEPVLGGGGSLVFQYCSHMSLPSCSGTMWGTFRFEREGSGEQFDARIPAFALETSLLYD